MSHTSRKIFQNYGELTNIPKIYGEKKLDLHIWNTATLSPLYYKSYCKTSGQLLRQNSKNKFVLYDHWRSRGARAVLLLHLCNSLEKIWSICKWGWREGGRGRWGSTAPSALHAPTRKVTLETQRGHLWQPRKAWLRENAEHGRLWHGCSLLIMIMSLVHNIDFPLLFAKTSNSWIQLFLLRIPKSSWSWTGWFPKKVLHGCGHLTCL